MKIKVLYFGEAAKIPETNLALGVSFMSVWIDNNGFTSASNDVGASAFVFLETEVVDIGAVDGAKAALFSNLHGRVVAFEIKPNTFAGSGGIARIKMTIADSSQGSLVESSIEFQAENCKGVSVSTGAISFSCEMLQLAQAVAMDDTLLGEETVNALQATATA